jgi:DNA invertase Pin-like site-specific DNA recombinase
VFNSLDAQREACEAYVLSQKHEGWVALPPMYDDGGISGGTLERPALKRLMDDIESGRVDTVVVYKVDRLTRSLSDFAKIVDVFDRNQVSFVSVTQQFNTTTSMGRLTLNMLLSFAQFEREVTGERIRDKIAASKRKGMWMGGVPPLGYEVKDRKLVIHAQEAETVGAIYRKYAELRSVRALKDWLDEAGTVSKIRIDKYGRQTGGKPFARGALYLLLQNRIYRGEIVHKDASYLGEHEAIVDEPLWNEVQQHLEQNRVDRKNGSHAVSPSLLAGLIYDETGERLVPTHANKKGRRYRYYVSQNLIKNAKANIPHGRRVPAGDLETLIDNRLKAFLTTPTEIDSAIETTIQDANRRHRLIQVATQRVEQWPTLKPAAKRALFNTLIHRIDLLAKTIEIHLYADRLPTILDASFGNLQPMDAETSAMNDSLQEGRAITLTLSAQLKRVGMETRLLLEGPSAGARRGPDRSLKRLIAQAYRYQDSVMHNSEKTMAALAAEAGVGGPYFSRVLRLSFLAPDIVQTILQDRHPIELNARRLAANTHLPIDWHDQRKFLGLD